MGNMPCCEKDQQDKESVGRPSRNVVRASAQKTIKTNNRQNVQNQITKQQPKAQPQNIQQRIINKHGPQNYQAIKYLGKGTFGDVVLAEDKQTSKQYAMKIIDKDKINEVNLMQSKKIKQIRNQDILVTIRQTFQSGNKIYIIMEYLNKGDIYFYLKKKQVRFNQDVIRDLIAEILYGVEILHNYGIIYRQLKPQNILVTNDGHIKLTDYGLSKMLIQNKTYTCTFVGALQYMAPQAIHGTYGKQIDIWSIGILIFQLIFQKNPFSSVQHTDFAIQKNIQSISIEEILNQNIGKISQQLRDLLIGLLKKNPKQRLTIEQIKNHPFFKSINWEDVRQRKNNPPLKQYIQKNDHIRFRDPTNDADLPARRIKQPTVTPNRLGVSQPIYQFRNSN